MRISDWSSDVCSSDLFVRWPHRRRDRWRSMAPSSVRPPVVGDLVRVVEGDVVPADGTAIEPTQLLVDESSLTGESLPASKQVGADGDEAMIWAIAPHSARSEEHTSELQALMSISS